MSWSEVWTGWEGSIKELVVVAQEVLLEEPQVEPVSVSVRLLRDYTQRGVLDRPMRRGKIGVYGYRHLVQFVVARWLLQDGWQLSKVAEVTSARSTEGLLALLPSAAPLNRAQELVRQFQGGDHRAAPVLTGQVRRLAQRTSSGAALTALGNEGGEVTREQRLQLTLTPWCTVSIDPARLSALTDAEIEMLGMTLIAALIDDPTRRGASR